MLTSLYETSYDSDHIMMLPMKYLSGLNTEFNFDWGIRSVYYGGQPMFPKGAGSVNGGVLGSFYNAFYGNGHNAYDDLPPLYSLQDETDRKFEARRYSGPKWEDPIVRDIVYRTYSPLREDIVMQTLNMSRIKMEDKNYVAYDDDYPTYAPRPYRYQDCYWLRSRAVGQTMVIRQLIGWAIYLFYNLPDITTATLGLCEHIGFTFLTGGRLSANNESYLTYMDPVPANPSTSSTLKHYGFGGNKSLTRPFMHAVVLKDFTKRILNADVRHTVVAVKGLYNWLDEPLYTGVISQPYLNFGYDGVPANGKVLMFGAEYYGEQPSST